MAVVKFDTSVCEKASREEVEKIINDFSAFIVECMRKKTR